MLTLSNWSAVITKPSDEGLSYPIQQFKMNGRTGDAYITAPYGMHYNLPSDQPALNLSPDGTILMGIDPVGRIKVEAGEVVFYHPKTKSKIHFKNNNDIDIEAQADINATCDNINVNATTKAVVIAPDVEITGNVKITGTVDITGATTIIGATSITGSIANNGKDIGDTHSHTQGADSDGDAQQNINGVT